MDYLNQIIFNALETEHSRAKGEEYREKVMEAMKAFKKSTEPKTEFQPSGICGSTEIGFND